MLITDLESSFNESKKDIISINNVNKKSTNNEEDRYKELIDNVKLFVNKKKEILSKFETKMKEKKNENLPKLPKIKKSSESLESLKEFSKCSKFLFDIRKIQYEQKITNLEDKYNLRNRKNSSALSYNNEFNSVNKSLLSAGGESRLSKISKIYSNRNNYKSSKDFEINILQNLVKEKKNTGKFSLRSSHGENKNLKTKKADFASLRRYKSKSLGNMLPNKNNQPKNFNEEKFSSFFEKISEIESSYLNYKKSLAFKNNTNFKKDKKIESFSKPGNFFL